MKSKLSMYISIAVLGFILIVGLWPFHSPRNNVTWLEHKNGIRFKRYGTVVTSGAFHTTSGAEASIEIWLQPRRIWDSGTFLALYDPITQRSLSFRQSQTGLLLQQQSPEDRGRRTKLYVDNIFQRSRSGFLTITGGPQGIDIYDDGVIVKTSSRFRLSPANFCCHLVIGDSPRQPDSWLGELFGLAIYERQLDASEVLAHYSTWTQTGRPAMGHDQHALARYLFDEHNGPAIHDHTGLGGDLRIPDRYQVLDKIVLEPFWNEFSISRSYWYAVLKNIIGFVPLGFSFYAWWSSTLRPKRAALATVALGTAVSIAIEILQGFLPMRQSGTSDIITNMLGTWIGVASYRISSPVLARFCGWPSFSGPQKKAAISRDGIRPHAGQSAS
jgi:hypothetical protein